MSINKILNAIAIGLVLLAMIYILPAFAWLIILTILLIWAFIMWTAITWGA